MEECLIYFKMCWDGKKYVYIVRYGIWELYVDTLLEMDLIYIYIYIYTLRDMEFKDVWEVCMGIL